MATSPTTTSHPDNALPQPPESLALDMFNATREIHDTVYKLVKPRLELALPPKTPNAGPYISGMLHFLPVYMTFERLWRHIIRENSPNEAAPDDDGKATVPEHVHAVLEKLFIPQLFRSDHLRADIKSMTGWSDDVLDQQIHTITTTGANELSSFISHIERSVHEKPHVLIAYSYNLFLALFAGGSYIREQFEKAGDEFWEADPKPIKLTMWPCEPSPTAKSLPEPTHGSTEIPLRFWRFGTKKDGENLKRDYKERLLKLEDGLSSEERYDIVKESVIILENIGLIIGQLDRIFPNGQKDSTDSTVDQPDNTYSDEQEENTSIQTPKRLSLAGFLGQVQLITRWRDSIIVTRERWGSNPLRSQSVNTTTSEEGEWDSENQDANHEDVARDTKLSPGTPKSVRFAESPAVTTRRRVRVAAAKDGSLHGMPKQSADVTVPWPVLAGVFVLFLLYIFIRVRGIMGWGYTATVQ